MKYIYSEPNRIKSLQHDDLGFSDSLMHGKKGEEMPGHKYKERKLVNGAWQYIYDHTLGKRKKQKELQSKINYYDELINRTLAEKIDLYKHQCDKILKDYPDAKSAYSKNYSYYKQYHDKLQELKDEQFQAQLTLDDLQDELKQYK